MRFASCRVSRATTEATSGARRRACATRDGRTAATGSRRRPAEPSFALVEVQGYAIDARRRMAGIYRRLGRQVEAEALELAARAHADAVEDRFWMEREGTYALPAGAGRHAPWRSRSSGPRLRGPEKAKGRVTAASRAQALPRLYGLDSPPFLP